MKRGTPDHPKTHELADRLKIPLYAAAGILARLWDTCAEYTPAGDIGKYSDARIARYVDWRKSSAALITALVDSRWIDRHPVHRLVVHDWSEHCEEAIHAKLARAGLTFADGVEPSQSKLSEAEKARALKKKELALKTAAERRPDRIGAAEYGGLPCPVLTCPVPDVALTEPRHSPEKTFVQSSVQTSAETTDPSEEKFELNSDEVDEAAALEARQEGWFAQFWSRYWRKVAKKTALAAFKNHVKTAERAEMVQRAVEMQRATMLARDPEGRPHAATWLNAERWEDEPAEVSAVARSGTKIATAMEMFDRRMAREFNAKRQIHEG